MNKKRILSLFVAWAFLIGCFSTNQLPVVASGGVSKEKSITFVADDIKIMINDKDFKLLDGIKAMYYGEAKDAYVKDDGDFKIETVGKYTITYGVQGFKDEATRVVEVMKEQDFYADEKKDETKKKDPQEEKNKDNVKDSIKEETKEDALEEAKLDVTPNAVEGINLKTSSTVETTSDLVQAIATAQEGDVVTLSPTFVPAEVTIPMPAVHVTLEGGKINWNNGIFLVNGTGTGSLTIKNITFQNSVDNSEESNQMVKLHHQNGTVTLERVILKNAQQGAVNVDTSATAKTVFEYVTLSDNLAKNTAPALYLGETSDMDIKYSTFENNTGTGGGYETGAISSKNYKGTLNITNSVFRSNKNQTLNTGLLGGGGGAMAMHYLRGNVKIEESYFVGNETSGSDSFASNTYDGGAIYVFDGRDGAEFTIDKTTFEANIAHDDGGAIMFQGTGNPGLTTRIRNSTFYNNIGHGLDGANVSGGAIQYFKNQSSSKMINTMTGTTVVGNVSGNENTKVDQKGGAIGLSGAGFLAGATVTRSNSLFYDNKVYDKNGNINNASDYKDISNTTAVQMDTNIINVDKGTVPILTKEDIFGIKNVMLSSNSSSVKAGVDEEIVKTIPIKPEGKAENISNEVVNGIDERGHQRYKDIGAVEVYWVKYDSNTGVFGLPELKAYDGSVYYLGSNPTQYYDLDKMASSAAILSDSTLAASKPGYKFLGWSTDKEAESPDPMYAPDSNYTYLPENLTLYAIWEPISYTVTYDGNTNTNGTVPTDDKKYLDKENATVLGEDTLVKEGYEFVGWNTKADGSGKDYATGDTIVMTGDITLYAKWKPLTYHITYDGNGHTGGTAPADTKDYMLKEQATVLGEETLVKAGHEFIGWNTKADGSGIDYSKDDVLTIIGDTILYAKWEGVAYHITYDGNGNTGGTAPTDLKDYFLRDEIVVSKEGTLIKEGYEFIGWNTKADGSGDSYLPEELLTMTGDTTLYAQWRPIIFHIIYDGNTNTGGIVPTDGKDYSPKEQATLLNKNTLEKEGFTFLGWNTKPDGTGTKYQPGDVITMTEDMILYAQWTPVIPPIPEPGNPNPPKGPSGEKTPNQIVRTPIKKLVDKVIPKTSDATNILGLISLFAIGTVGIMVSFSFRRKKQNK